MGNWYDGSPIFIEFGNTYESVTIGQYPNANTDDTTRTVREALVYKNTAGETATAQLIFNIRFQTGVTAYSYLADIDYIDPTVKEKEETLNVERYPALGYGTTEATVDLTAAKTFLGVKEVTTDIEGMEVVLNDRVDVYTVAGTKVKSHVQRLNATEGLPAGIYLVGGKKVIVK